MPGSQHRAGVWRALVAAAVVAGCHSDAATTPSRRESLDVSADRRVELEAAMLFAGEQPTLGLAGGPRRDEIAHGFAAIARQVSLDDRRGVAHAVAQTRSAIERYHATPDAGDAAIELAALAFTLDHASELARAPGSRRHRK